ncbi:hypothetical protein [Pseudodesulfovibrio indicus]|uniref:Uncharacterized protein n=1 Tax=Pseudodesulfovibrio indicus TaxID=1716143 RepID=A0A126QJU8_9BACT|nr:hypothetical protein [Pseudodesulfovibrio indicus]AMK10057.1 hypothetical protein AWY79_02470 [Pseudodesulfovibrio indicus]TDT86973.1 hypothetical protein EDC59_11054 [Pseudodesulfovibrio indicus]
MQSKRRHSRTAEWTRNILLILAAAAVIFIFFNLDIVRKGESVFSQSADKKLKFAGELHRRDYVPKEVQRLLDYIKVRNKLIEEVRIEASPQDRYREIGPNTAILFEVHVTLSDDFTFSTPVRRTRRGELVTSVLAKLDKDIQAYLDLKKQGKNPSSMINTM